MPRPKRSLEEIHRGSKEPQEEDGEGKGQGVDTDIPEKVRGPVPANWHCQCYENNEIIIMKYNEIIL